MEQVKISPFQLGLLVISIVAGSNLAPIEVLAKRDTWICIIMAMILGSIFIWAQTTLATKYTGKNLVQINELIYGKKIGIVINLFYSWYFMQLIALQIFDFSEFYKNLMLRETPQPVIAIVFLLLCGWAVWKGMEVIARCSEIVIPIIILAVIGTLFLIIPNFKFTNFLPYLQITTTDLIRSSSSLTAILFGEIICFLMIIPMINNHTKLRSAIFIGMYLGGALILLGSVYVIAVLGNTMEISSYPLLQLVRLIDLGEFFSRMEVLVTASFFWIIFLKIAVIYYAMVLNTAEIFKLKNMKPLIFPLGVLGVNLAFILFDNSGDHYSFIVNGYPQMAIPYQFVIPLISLLVIWIRKSLATKKEI